MKKAAMAMPKEMTVTIILTSVCRDSPGVLAGMPCVCVTTNQHFVYAPLARGGRGGLTQLLTQGQYLFLEVLVLEVHFHVLGHHVE